MIQAIAALLRSQESTNDMSKKITKEQYEAWKHKLVFERLRGLRTGQSFCNEFNISDNHLFYNTLNERRMFEYIEETYVQS